MAREAAVVVALGVPGERQLQRLLEDTQGCIGFHEPDLRGELTAVALVSGPTRALNRLPLLLRSRGREVNDDEG